MKKTFWIGLAWCLCILTSMEATVQDALTKFLHERQLDQKEFIVQKIKDHPVSLVYDKKKDSFICG